MNCEPSRGVHYAGYCKCNDILKVALSPTEKLRWELDKANRRIERLREALKYYAATSSQMSVAARALAADLTSG